MDYNGYLKNNSLNYQFVYKQVHQIFLDIPIKRLKEMCRIYLSKDLIHFNKDILEEEIDSLRREYQKKILLIGQLKQYLKKMERRKYEIEMLSGHGKEKVEIDLKDFLILTYRTFRIKELTND